MQKFYLLKQFVSSNVISIGKCIDSLPQDQYPYLLDSKFEANKAVYNTSLKSYQLLQTSKTWCGIFFSLFFKKKWHTAL